MKRFSMIAASFVFAAVFAVSTFAQAGAGKIGFLDTSMFADEKEGVTKYNNALKQLDKEMQPSVVELQGIQAKLKTISDELQKLSSVPGGIADPKAAQAKQDEGQRLQREFEFKKKEYDARVAKRSDEVLGPVTNDILKAVQDYAKLKGYTAILDLAALVNQNINAVIALDAGSNITKDFITYYNTKPATTATTATPKP